MWVIVTADRHVKGVARIARISRIYAAIPGGVMLDRRILDFQSWNVADLRRATRAERIAAGGPAELPPPSEWSRGKYGC